MKIFKNKPNEEVQLPDGRTVYLSRSVAVTAVVIGYDVPTDTHHALIGLRGQKLDEPNKWCLPCGYLDYNETLIDAVKREVYEETGIDLDEQGGYIHPVPVAIQSDPTENRQNITCRFLVDIPHLPETHTRFAEEGEVIESKWIPLTKSELDRYDWAFKHKEILLHHLESMILDVGFKL